ncbi:hypothetical protein ACS0TY_030452 [Phlomoides rotata]
MWVRGSFWKPPRLGNLNLNSNARVFSDGSVGLGFVVRNAEGHRCWRVPRFVTSTGNSVLLEGLALRFGVIAAMCHGLEIDVLESDST